VNFKEIRLVGFKSFADKTSVKFDDGVTCIVGPNGCGKSNVADAVRWVLGEQSAKTLRGTSMQDVIFNGTEARRQLSYCEVTLVFDNAEKLFDIEYEEVAMTRRLYRSGESEYLLNMQPCRLKDIVALLHGVGIGKEGYSIIGQGKVEQIMNAKPEDRRSIFEEATGVMKFKAQKGEIERKLENAKGNLTVFVQRMDEAEKQIRPLEKQAETARKYREFSQQLRYEEVNSYLVHYDSFAVETEKYRVRIAEAGEKLAGVEARLVAVDEEEALSREEIRKADDRLRSLNEKLRLFEVGMEHKTGEAKVIGERIQSYRRQLSQATDDVEYSIRRTKEIDTLVAQSALKQKAGEERAKEIETESEALYRKLQEADARVAAYERISNEKRASELSSVENLADVRANVGSLEAKRDAASERIFEVKEAIQKAENRRAEYARQLEACRAEKDATEKFLDESQSRGEELSQEAADLARSRLKLTEEIVDCNTSIANLSNNLELYRNLKNRFDGYRDSVRKLQLTAKDNPEIGSRLKGAIADIISTEKKYEVAIETAFGAAMQNLVTADSDDARYLIEYLKRTGGGIVTFLPVSAMRPRGNTREITQALGENGALGLAEELVTYDGYYDNVIKNLLGNTLVCDTIASATQISKKFPRAFKIVTLDGDTIATSGAMTGGSRRKESGNLLAGERHIKECEEGIARKQASLEKLKEALASCESELEEAQRAKEAFRVKVQEETANFAASAQRELALAGLVSDAERDKEEYDGLLNRLTQQIDVLQSEVLSSAENEDLLNKIRSEAAEEASKREEEVAQLKSERDELSGKYHALQVEGASLKSIREADEATVLRLQREKEQLLSKVEDTRKAMLQTETLIEQLKRQEEKVALTEEEQHTVAVLRDRLAESEESKRLENEKQARYSEEKRGLLTRQMSLSDEKHSYELEISKAETNLENLKQRIGEAYNLSYESAQELRDPAYEVAQSQSRITSLKRSITMLGPVNQNAEEDYNALMERYQDMLTQRDDLDKGIGDLTTVLDALKAEMQEKFDKGFNEINANFTQIFKELFGGGRAEMQLDYENCEDPLNAGVEIVACPPGKKLTKISLLSGGERAFTAIAILFAILKSRPMPFCILDEIEAALDEANVDRFAKYLKKFSRDTQFIVITHRKPTMNQADSLFGVTMEEKGVSKIVSVKLSEVEAKLGGDTVI
jgi:chromosome segregation protein